MGLTISALSIQPDEREAARNEVIAAARNWRRGPPWSIAIRNKLEAELIGALSRLDTIEAKKPTS